jgi:N-acyl-D-amino-acid deacylase
VIKKALTAILLSCLSVSVWAAPVVWSSTASIPVTSNATANTRWFEQQILYLMKKWGIPGGSAAIVRNGQVIYAGGFGYANLSTHAKVQPDSLFRVASVSKVITAVAVLKLIDQGKLSLNSSAYDVLDLKPLPGMRMNSQVDNITIKNLLTMSSGWTRHGRGIDPMFGPWPDSMTEKLGGQMPASCLQSARYMMSMPLQYKPGTSYAYYNFNYCLLGLVVAKVGENSYSMQAYEDYVKKNVLAPAGVTDMQIGGSTTAERLPNEVSYYPYDPGTPSVSGLPYSNATIIESNAADGGWLASAVDLAKFGSAVASGKIINRSLIQAMISKYLPVDAKSSKYQGLGWRLIRSGKYLAWYKTGSFTGTNSLVVKRADGTVVAVIFNTMPGDLGRFRVGLMSILLSKKMPYKQ